MPQPIRGFRVVEGIADLVLAATEDGGLPRALSAPSQSIVFRFVDGDLAGTGAVAIIEATAIEPGTEFRARVVFPDAPPDGVFADRSFELWLGHPVGSAVVVDVESDDTRAGTDADPKGH